MMHPHHQTSSSVSASLSTSVPPSSSSVAQRDRERQREREQRRQQAMALANANNGGIHQSAVVVGGSHHHHKNQINNMMDKPTHLFPVPVRSEQEDDTSKEIKSTLGEFGKLMPFLTKKPFNYSSDVINSNLVGISRNEINRRRVQEIFAEMIPHEIVPSKPITGLDDLVVAEQEQQQNDSESSTVLSNYHSQVKNQQTQQNISSNTHLNSSHQHQHHTPMLSPPQSSTLQHMLDYFQINNYQQNNSLAQVPPATSKPVGLKLEEKIVNNSKSSRLSSASSSNEDDDGSSSSSSSSSSDDDSNDDDEDDDSSGDEDSGSDNSDNQSDNDSETGNQANSKNKNPKNRRRKSKDVLTNNLTEVDARVKLKSDSASNILINNNMMNNNQDEDEEHKWDLDNFLPPGASSSNNKDTQPSNSKDTKSLSYFNNNNNSQDILNNNNNSKPLIDSHRDRNKTNQGSITATKTSNNRNKTTSLNNKVKQSKTKQNSTRTPAANSSKKSSYLKMNESSDEDSHESDRSSNHRQTNNDSNHEDDSNDFTLIKQEPLRRKRHQENENDEEMEEGELDDTIDHIDLEHQHDLPLESNFRSKSSTAKQAISTSTKSSVDRINNQDSSNRIPLLSNINKSSYTSNTESTSKTSKKLNNKKKQPPPPPLIQPLPPPPKFDNILGSSGTSANKTKNRITSNSDEDSWKDAKRRKDPVALPSKSSKSDNLINNNHHQLAITSESKNESKSSTSNRLTMANNNKPKSSKYSSHSINKKESDLSSSYTRKVELNPTIASNSEQPHSSLIVSIELPKLNRIPQVDRNGNLDHPRSSSPISVKTSKSDSKKNSKEFKSTQQRSDTKYLNGKSGTSVASSTSSLKTTPVKTMKPDVKCKSEIDHSRHSNSSSRHSSSSHHHLQVSPPQPSTSLPVSIPMNINSITLRTSPHIHQTSASSSSNLIQQQHRSSPICQTEQEAQSMARTLKRKADLIKIPQQQILQYIEASMYFIQAGLIMEQKRLDSEMDKAYLLYRDTLQLIKLTTSKLSKNRTSLLMLMQGSQEQANLIDLKLTILSYRCQALLNSRLTRMRAREMHENKEIIGQFFKSNEQLLGGHPNSSSSSSTNSSTTTITVPVQIMSLIYKQMFLLQQSNSANDLWIKSETMMELNPMAKEFFQQIDQECGGGGLHFSSSLEQLIHHTLKGVKSIQASLAPLNVNVVTANIGNPDNLSLNPPQQQASSNTTIHIKRE